MSFSATVKDELCRLELGKNCCMLSELAALYRTSGSLTFHGGGRVQVQYRVENTALARRIFRLLTARMAITPRLHYVQHARLGGRRTCVLTIGDEDSQRLMLALHLIDKDENGVVSYRRTIVRHHLTRQCCRRAYLRAAFLGAGTMTSPDKDYHFEITASEPGLVRELTLPGGEPRQRPATAAARHWRGSGWYQTAVRERLRVRSVSATSLAVAAPTTALTVAVAHTSAWYWRFASCDSTHAAAASTIAVEL